MSLSNFRNRAFMLFPLLLGLALGLALGETRPASARAEIVPTPVYRVPLGVEAEEIERSVRQLENAHQQILLMKRLLETKDWAGIGRMIGDPRMTGLIDQLELTLNASKRACDDLATICPSLSALQAGSAADYARRVAEKAETARRARQAVLQVMTERYADSVVDASGVLVAYRRANSIPAFVNYARDANNSLGAELNRLNNSSDGGLMKAMQLNSQIELANHAALLQVLQTLSDQNRLLTLMIPEPLGQ